MKQGTVRLLLALVALSFATGPTSVATAKSWKNKTSWTFPGLVRMVRCDFKALGPAEETKVLIQVRSLEGDELLWEQPATSLTSLGNNIYRADVEIPQKMIAALKVKGGARYVGLVDARGASDAVWFVQLSVTDLNMAHSPPTGETVQISPPPNPIQGHTESWELSPGPTGSVSPWWTTSKVQDQ